MGRVIKVQSGTRRTVSVQTGNNRTGVIQPGERVGFAVDKAYVDKQDDALRDAITEKVVCASRADFPNIGKEKTVYIAIDEDACYRWSDQTFHYYCVGRDWQEIQIIRSI